MILRVDFIPLKLYYLLEKYCSICICTTYYNATYSIKLSLKIFIALIIEC